MRSVEYEYTTLSPGDQHLCRYGNYLVAKEISKLLKTRGYSFSKNKNPTTAFRHDLGSFGPWSGTYLKSYFNYARYDVLINNIGIRGNHDLIIPKSKCRIACIGDSFTYGHGVLNEHTYPNILANLDSRFEILNFGILCTTILSQIEMLKNTRDLEVDYVILQVGDNDLIDLMTHHQEISSIVEPVSRASEEITFLRKIGKM